MRQYSAHAWSDLTFGPFSLMASAVPLGEAILIIKSVVRGHHIYKDYWTPEAAECLGVAREDGNEHDQFAVGVVKSGVTVGHVPREYSRMFYYFLLHGGRISCKITGHRKLGKGLEVPCDYTLIGAENSILRAKEIVQRIKKKKSHQNNN